MTQQRWAKLPRPVAFVLSGGASLGAVQAGMAQALAGVGLEPDTVVGTSVGALNGAVIAESAGLADAAGRLVDLWCNVHRDQVLPGSGLAQAWSVVRSGHLHGNQGLRRFVAASLRSRTFDDLALPLAVVVGNTLTGHTELRTSGDLVTALLAATALPGVFPPVELEGTLYWDAGPVATVPLMPAVRRGVGTIVVLDAGDVCHLSAPPRGIPDGVIHAASTAMRQRVLLEAPMVARRIPLVYLPRPCVEGWSLLDIERSHTLIDPARELVTEFLRTATVPAVGAMSGSPHQHGAGDDRPAVAPPGAGTEPTAIAVPAPPSVPSG